MIDAPEDLPVWKVYVLHPLIGRQRKHTVMVYRVGAQTKEKAISAVRSDILHDEHYAHKGLRIVACTEFSRAGRVVCDGVVHWEPERAANIPTL